VSRRTVPAAVPYIRGSRLRGSLALAPRASRARWRRVLAATVLSGLAATVAVLGLSTPAGAHGQFVSADPAPNAEVAHPLASILIYFTEKPASNAYFAVTTPSGVRVDRLWSHGTPRELDEPVHEWYHNDNGEWETRAYEVAYPALIPIAYWPEQGAYKVSFASVATDNEPVRGEYTFNYSGAISEMPADFRPQKNEPDPNLLAAAATDAPTAPPSALPIEEQVAAEEAGPGLWIIWVPVGVALLVAVIIYLFWLFRPQQARAIMVSRFGGRYAAAPQPRRSLQLPAKLEERLPTKLRERLPGGKSK
jgi:methionine-rich copper-binding protein CopC